MSSANQGFAMMRPVQRTCRYGHGRLELLTGTFSLAGLRPPNAVEALFPDKAGTRRPDGRLFAVKVWRCQDCGYVELFDEDSNSTVI